MSASLTKSNLAVSSRAWKTGIRECRQRIRKPEVFGRNRKERKNTGSESTKANSVAMFP